MAPQGFQLLYPDVPTESLFSEFLSQLPSQQQVAVREAILSLDKKPRPHEEKHLHYLEVDPEALKLFFRTLPGIAFEKGEPSIYLDYLYARHRITVRGITIVYAIDDIKKYVWLMGIRKST